MNLDRLTVQRRIEASLAPWRRPGRPGVTVGVVLDGELALRAHAGEASVELGVPIGDGTRFRIASVSKQFTCAAILMLRDEGRLSLDDDARELLPELAGIGERITVADLMHNGSGLRDMFELLRQGGADLATPVRLQAFLDAVSRQRTLNFRPGSRYLYSNSNFMLLGVLAERLSGTPLPELLRDRIFAPLGMTRTEMTPDLARVVPGLATGYLGRADALVRARHAFPLHGEGGLVSCVEDLAIWDRNFATRRVGGAWLDELARQRPFPTGALSRYARGLTVRGHRGVETVSHGGLWPGYRTEFLRAPAIGATVIVMANYGLIDPNRIAHRVLDAVLDGRSDAMPGRPEPRADAAGPLIGRFVDPETGETLDIGPDADGAVAFTRHGLPAATETMPDGRVAAARAPAAFLVRATAPDTIEVEREDGALATWMRAPASAPLPDGLAGRYRCEETAASWVIDRDADGLVVRACGPVVASTDPWPVEPVAPDLVRVHLPGTLYRSWLDVRVRRGAEGSVDALLASGGRALDLEYRRTGPEAPSIPPSVGANR